VADVRSAGGISNSPQLKPVARAAKAARRALVNRAASRLGPVGFGPWRIAADARNVPYRLGMAEHRRPSFSAADRHDWGVRARGKVPCRYP